MICSHCGHTLQAHVSIDECHACKVEVAWRNALVTKRGADGDAEADACGLAEYVCADFDH